MTLLAGCYGNSSARHPGNSFSEYDSAEHRVTERERERWREDVMLEEDLRTSPKLMDRTRAETSCTSSGGKLRVERGDWPAEQQIVSRVHLSSGDDYSFTLELQ